jgi:hypothetical protein
MRARLSWSNTAQNVAPGCRATTGKVSFVA